MTQYPRYPVTLHSFPGWQLGADLDDMCGWTRRSNYLEIYKDKVQVGYRVTSDEGSFDYLPVGAAENLPGAARRIEDFGRAATAHYGRLMRDYRQACIDKDRPEKEQRTADIARALGLTQTEGTNQCR